MAPSPFLTAISQRWALLLELLHDPLCRHCGVALPAAPRLTLRSTLFCNPCLKQWGFCPDGVDTGYANIHALCQLTPTLKKVLYGHKFYGGRHHQRLLQRLWLHGQPTVNALLKRDLGLSKTFAPVWVVSIPSRHRNDFEDATQPRLRPIETLFSSVCQGWTQPNAPVRYLGPTGLMWQRDTWPQHRLTQRKERLTNMHHALTVSEDLWQQQTVKHVLPSAIVVLDDLVTTGATAQAALNAIGLWCQNQGLSHIPQKVIALAHVPLE